MSFTRSLSHSTTHVCFPYECVVYELRVADLGSLQITERKEKFQTVGVHCNGLAWFLVVEFPLLFSYLLTSSASHQPKVEDCYAYPTSQICYIFTTSSHYLFFFYPSYINNTPRSSLICTLHSLHPSFSVPNATKNRKKKILPIDCRHPTETASDIQIRIFPFGFSCPMYISSYLYFSFFTTSKRHFSY
ncbi:hypothetical protein V8G54_010220 [Vigna mungo]|uniref:Uncharacterized protein n=1 Tax=Vigna mungo TaxID=3915 RepID=A0AAQ3S5K5_VIGMU